MTLTLSVLRCPDAVPPETRRVPGGDYTIGRGSEADWPLADPDRVLSKRHCTLEFRNGGWQVRDTSTNGTYLNRQTEPIGQGMVCELRDGDRLRLGGYELEVRVEAEEAWEPAAPARPAARGRDAFDDPMFGGPAPERHPFGTPPAPVTRPDDISIGLGGPSEGKLLPDDFDFDTDPFGSAPTQPDHAPPGQQAFAPPRPAQALLPDDDDDWLAAPAATPPPPSPAPLATPPVVPPAVTQPPAPRFAPPPMAASVAVSASPFAEPGDVPVPARPPPPRPAGSPPPAAGDLLAAFLRGAGMDAQPADPIGTMTSLGAAFRALVGGLRQVLVARASIKGEFRIEQTMVRARGNNPLKFSAGDDDALLALLGAGRRTDMTADQAVGEALRDIRLHELATMAAMQHAVRALLARLDPAPLRAEAEKTGGLLQAAPKARAFDAYQKLHADITVALADDFDRVFGKAFALAYEQALSDAAGKEPK